MLTGSVQCNFNSQAAWGAFAAATPKTPGLHLWHGNVSALSSFENKLHALLNSNDRERTSRFYRPGDRLRYTIQHGLLKLLLRWYLADAGFEPDFGYNPNKKPFLINHPTCYFNLSNTGDEFLIAIADVPIGIDIEPIKPGFAYRDIAAHYFNPAEIAFIDTASNPPEAFFLLWTRKEALLKATGRGIDDDLPLIPALDGMHVLPAQFEAVDWLTESFLLAQNMVSVTIPSPGMQLHRWLITKDFIPGCDMSNLA